MRDINGSSFVLLSLQEDWDLPPPPPKTVPAALGGRLMFWDPTARVYTLDHQQQWRLPGTARSAALTALAASEPWVVDGFGGIARIRADGSTIESQDGADWVPLTDLNGVSLAPKIGRFIAMALGGARLALVASDGTNAFLELFDLRGRWPLDSVENPACPIPLDPVGAAVVVPSNGPLAPLAVAPDGPIYVIVQGGLAIYEGGPIEQIIERQTTRFEPLAANPAPLRQTALLASRPGGAVIAMSVDAQQVALLSDQGTEPQTIALLDRATGAWVSAPLEATDGTALPWCTDIGLLDGGLIALMAPLQSGAAGALRDCAVVTLVPQVGVTLAASRYPMLDQTAPRFTAIPGPDVRYLGVSGPRALLPLPHPGFVAQGAIARFGLTVADPDLVWHRLYLEAHVPPGTSLSVWVRATDPSAANLIAATDQDAAVACLLAAPTTSMLGPTAAGVAAGGTLAAALTIAPFHRQPPLVASPLPSELPFHPGLAAQQRRPGALYEVLLQRAAGANRRLTGGSIDLVIVATGDGRHSPCLRAVRIYTPRFCYQDEYLPALFHQLDMSDESDLDPAVSPPDFRERLLASLEGMLTPIEGRAANAELLLDAYAAPLNMLPWLGSFLNRSVDPSWPEARQRRSLGQAGLLLTMRATYRGVCLALDIATDGAVARGEVVLIETHRLRRTNATILGVPLSGLNVLTEDGVASGNSIVGDTLVLSAERAIDVLALLAPAVAQGADATQVAQFLDQYADRVQVAAVVHGDATLVPAVTAVLRQELPAQLNFEVIFSQRSFVLGLAPLLGIDTYLEPADAPAALRLNQSVLGRDTVIRDPAALRQ